MKKTFLTSLFAITLAACSEAVVPEPQPVEDTTDTVSEVLDAVTEEPEIIIEENTDAETEDEEPVIVVDDSTDAETEIDEPQDSVTEEPCIPSTCEYGQFFDYESCSCLWCKGDANSDCCLDDMCFGAVHYDGQSTFMVSTFPRKIENLQFATRFGDWDVLSDKYIDEEASIYVYSYSEHFQKEWYSDYMLLSPFNFTDKMCPEGTHTMNSSEFYALFNANLSAETLESLYTQDITIDSTKEVITQIISTGDYDNWYWRLGGERMHLGQDIFGLHLFASNRLEKGKEFAPIVSGSFASNYLLGDRLMGTISFLYNTPTYGTTLEVNAVENISGKFEIRCVLDK